MEAVRCLKRRISDAIYRQLVADQQRADSDQVLPLEAGPGGHCGASQESSAASSPRTPALHYVPVSPFPERPTDATPDAASPEDRTHMTTRTHPLTTEAEVQHHRNHAPSGR